MKKNSRTTKNTARPRRPKRAKAEAYEREKAEEDAWMQRNRPDEWKRLQREKENHRRVLEERAKRQNAKDKWQAGWRSETVADVVAEIVEATADMNAFTAKYYDCYDRPGPGLFRDWCHRIRDAYQREHHGK